MISRFTNAGQALEAGHLPVTKPTCRVQASRAQALQRCAR
jgi:hypothetical protein